MRLSAAIQHVFGVAAPSLNSASAIQYRALEFNPSTWNGDSSSCAGYVNYLGRDDVIDVAIAERHSSEAVADLFHFFLDAVLAAVPFRHEVFLVEVAAPHALWYGADGSWTLSTDSLFAQARTFDTDPAAFASRYARALWLFYLFPNSATWIKPTDVRAMWRADGSPSRDAILAAWESSPRGCGDTLGALWGGYFTGGTQKTLASLLDAASAHPSAAVRSSARLVRELDSGQRGSIHDEIRANLQQFWKT